MKDMQRKGHENAILSEILGNLQKLSSAVKKVSGDNKVFLECINDIFHLIQLLAGESGIEVHHPQNQSLLEYLRDQAFSSSK